MACQGKCKYENDKCQCKSPPHQCIGGHCKLSQDQGLKLCGPDGNKSDCHYCNKFCDGMGFLN